MPASASRRCASFWAPSCAFLSSGRMHERDLWPYLPRCGRSGAAVRVLRRWRLSYIPRRDQRAVRHLRALWRWRPRSLSGRIARSAGELALVVWYRRSDQAATSRICSDPLRFTAPAGDQAPAHAALEIRSRRDVEAARTVTGREQPFRSGRAPPPGAGLRRSAMSEGSCHVAAMLGQIQLCR